jgi:hypothetical protein
MWGYYSDYPKTYRDGREWAVINGRLYSEHACERMAPSYLKQAGSRYDGRGVPPSYVEDAIRYGSGTDQEDGTTLYRYGTLKVSVRNDNGAVVTVMN